MPVEIQSPVETMTAGQIEDLERLIDRVGLESVLRALAAICGEKASHIEHAWQDRRGASPWRKIAARIDNHLMFQAKGL